MALLLTPARIAAVDIPIIGPDGQAGNDGSPFGAPSHAPVSGTTSADVVESLAGLQANETGSPFSLTPTVAGGTGGRGGSGTDFTAQNAGNDGWGGWATVSTTALAVGTIATPFESRVNVLLTATGGFAGGGGIAGQSGPAGSTGLSQRHATYAGSNITDPGYFGPASNGGNGGNGGGASAALNGMTAFLTPLIEQAQLEFNPEYQLTALGENGTAGGNGGRGGEGGLFSNSVEAVTLSGSGGRGGTGGRGIAIINGAALSYQGSYDTNLSLSMHAVGGNGANGGAGGDASLLRELFGTEGVYGTGGNGGAGGAGGRAAAVFSQNSIMSTHGLYLTVGLSASAGAGGQGGAGGSGGGSSALGVTGSVTPGVPGLAGQAGANGQAIIAINANNLQLGAGSWLQLGIYETVGGVRQTLNTSDGAILQFNGNVFQTAGASVLDLQTVFGGSAIVDVGAGTLTIAGSPANHIGGFDFLFGTSQGGDRFIDGPGAQAYSFGQSIKSLDTVVFHPGHGADTVSPIPLGSLIPLASFGKIELDGFGPTLSTFSQVLAGAVDVGKDTKIATPDGGSIMVIGYHAVDLTAADFHFG